MSFIGVRICKIRYFLRSGQLSRRTKATVINGTSMALDILKALRIKVEEFRTNFRRVPHLTAILVGNDPSSKLYVHNKLKAAKSTGIKASVISIESNVEEGYLKQKIRDLNNNAEIDSILIQLPLPSHINASICNEILPEKDVDGFTSENIGKFYLNEKSCIPCTALAIHRILKETKIQTVGKNTVICGRSKHVGLPIAMLMHSNFNEYGFNTNTTICHRFTPQENLENFCREADIVISATGVPNLIRGHMIKKDAVVIDVGICRTVDPETQTIKFVGDVNVEEVIQVASFLTPVPGGVGPLTVAMLMQNTLNAAKQRIVRNSNLMS